MPLRIEAKLKLCVVFSSNAEPEVKLRKVNIREFDGFNQLTSAWTRSAIAIARNVCPLSRWCYLTNIMVGVRKHRSPSLCHENQFRIFVSIVIAYPIVQNWNNKSDYCFIRICNALLMRAGHRKVESPKVEPVFTTWLLEIPRFAILLIREDF